MMQDPNASRSDPMVTLGDIGGISPEIVEARDRMSDAAPAKAKLGENRHTLIAPAMAVSTLSPGRRRRCRAETPS